MMTIRIDVNGDTIAIVDIVNRGPLPRSAMNLSWRADRRLYEWTEAYHRHESGVHEPTEIGTVEHNRDDGAARLAALVLQQLSERRQ
jgi:hypothetical protein